LLVHVTNVARQLLFGYRTAQTNNNLNFKRLRLVHYSANVVQLFAQSFTTLHAARVRSKKTKLYGKKVRGPLIREF
jgi:cbb3-type cytochrome oxidase subunit 1